MKKRKTFYFFIGTVAELIKLSAVLKRFRDNKISFKIITSGQNDINFEELEPIIGRYKADVSFNPKPKESSPFKFALWALKAIPTSIINLKKEFKNIKAENTLFIVHGDTVSALIGAIVAKFYRLKLIHIEAGYRSFNFFEPFPEEITRVLISYLADIHFCPDDWSLNNIKNHAGIKISTGENTLYETCMNALKKRVNSKIVKEITKYKYFLLILHRQEHVLYKRNLTKKYIKLLTSFAKPEIKCVFVLHQLTENFLKEQNLYKDIHSNANIITAPRLPYLIFLKIMSKAEFIATDGGSNQDEAYFLGMPCLLLREYTEQVEGLGANAVLAKDDLSLVKRFLETYKSKRRKTVSCKTPPSKVITDFLIKNII